MFSWIYSGCGSWILSKGDNHAFRRRIAVVGYSLSQFFDPVGAGGSNQAAKARDVDAQSNDVTLKFAPPKELAMLRSSVLTATLFISLASSVVRADDDAPATDCGALASTGYYDQGMHIAAIFIIFGVSILGSMLPVVTKSVAFLRNAIALLNSFGFGVVIATAFIHMIPPAIETLNNPCLNVGYDGLAMVFVVLTVLAMQSLETELVLFLGGSPASSSSDTSAAIVEKGDESIEGQVTLVGHNEPYHSHHHHHGGSHDMDNSTMRKKINVLIFEIGVAIHSVIIGLDLGVATGSTFTTLLVALCFHQFFEGVAVGTSAVTAFSNLRSAIMTAVGYSLTTPLGIVIGIGIKSSYSDTSVTSMWVRGTLDAIAGGILVYTGLVELLTYHYTINPEFHAKSNGLRFLNYLFIWLGSGAMAVVGYWT
ncbi:hypothetical protein LEN26_003478 [Aphanomyces euteiches]|nr:hypothetical protein AeMF1_006144 [Aphanomyces euteiches]KAH9153882.1 hypothetical protein LEN26_003478 [Aphanomyces euteiches]KAH9183433.1 hypothetical protein AeNC1_014590 [Aphanomyces euteiches]